MAKTTIANNQSGSSVRSALNTMFNDLYGYTVQATNSVLGLVKLYTNLSASNTDGAPSQAAVVSGLSTKQDALVSSTNIKTINGTTLLGSGDLVISGSSIPVTSITTTGGTHTLNFNSKDETIFEGLTSFTGSKTITLSNATVAKLFSYSFVATGSGVALTFPSDFKSSDNRFSGLVLTLTGAGNYEVSALKNSVTGFWNLKADLDGGAI